MSMACLSVSGSGIIKARSRPQTQKEPFSIMANLMRATNAAPLPWTGVKSRRVSWPGCVATWSRWFDRWLWRIEYCGPTITPRPRLENQRRHDAVLASRGCPRSFCSDTNTIAQLSVHRPVHAEQETGREIHKSDTQVEDCTGPPLSCRRTACARTELAHVPLSFVPMTSLCPPSRHVQIRLVEVIDERDGVAVAVSRQERR